MRSRIHLPRIYYVLTVVAVAAIVLTLFLREMLGEAAAWLGVLVAAELAFCLPLFMYVAIAFVLPE